jgi:hypothetical protein
MNIFSKTVNGLLLANNNDPVIPGQSVNDVLDAGSESFGVVQNFFTLIGIAISIWTLWKVIKYAALAKPADAVKFFVGGLVAAIFCFDISLPLSLVEGMGGVFRSAFDTLSDLTGN